jgi:hypothetical protein
MRKKRLGILFAATIALTGVGATTAVAADVAVAAVDVAGPAAIGCTLTPTYNGSVSVVSAVNCTGGAKVRPWIKYYANDNTTVVSVSYGAWVTSGTSSVSRPSGSFAHSGGYGLG